MSKGAAAKRRSDPRIERFRRFYKRHRSNYSSAINENHRIVPVILALLPMHFHRSNPFFVNTKIRTGSVCVLCPPRKSSSLSGPYRRNRAPCLKQCLSVLIVPITEIVNLFSLLELFLPAHSTPSSDLSSRSQLSIATSWATTARFSISHFYQNSSKT